MDKKTWEVTPILDRRLLLAKVKPDSKPVIRLLYAQLSWDELPTSMRLQLAVRTYVKKS